MKCQKRKFMVVIVIFCLSLIINTGSGAIIPVYVGVNYDTTSVSLSQGLEVKNYSILVNVEGKITPGLDNYAVFAITKGTMTYFTFSVEESSININDTIERRLIITELGDYDFNFDIYCYSGDYLNFEILLAETEIIYHPKTSIISEAPYGFAFIIIALIGVAIVNSRRRNRR